MGFYDSVVAAPSQVAALRAWGVRQNLFADGTASLAQDAQAIEAALAHPETPLKRAVGSSDPFGLEAALPKAPEAPRKPNVSNARATGPSTPKPLRPPPDRSKLDAAEAALRKLDDDRKGEEADLKGQQADLDRRSDAAQVSYVEGRKVATAAVVAARTSYREAGGRA